MLAAIHALQGQKVDVLTTSIELSIPEVKKQAPFFEMLGLTIGENSKKNAADDEAKHAIYQKDVVYGTAEDFQADIISTEFFRRNIRGDRGFGVVLVDEVDNMLYDGRNYSTQLSGLTPAMNHLEIVLGAAWNQVNQIASRLRTINGQCYLITEKFQDVEGGVVLPEGKELASCGFAVEDQVEFLKQHTTAYLEKLLRKLTPEDRKKLEAYRAQELRIEQLKEETGHDETQQKSATEAALEALKKEPWSQEEEYLEIPAHLQDLARAQIPHWVESAIHALLGYRKGQHYHVKGGKIVTIDYSNTGVLQYNTVWENGLAQFLQIKEGLKVIPEGIATNFISKPGYFKRYEHRLYGLTGTLGNATTRNVWRGYGHHTTLQKP
jgi:preprotein translocase subunit SecA